MLYLKRIQLIHNKHLSFWLGRLFVLLLTGLLFSSSLYAQVPENQEEPQGDSLIYIEYANIKNTLQNGVSIRTLVMGNGRQVELHQGDTWMYCDSAILSANKVIARGNVIIQQGDSTSIFADSLRYNGNSRKSALYGNVLLQDKQQSLETDKLYYNLDTKVGTYETPAKLTDGKTFLSSKKGSYNTQTKEAFFKDSVVVIDPSFTLFADTLRFDTEKNIAYFLGPTQIQQEAQNIFCDAGYYDLDNQKAEFTKNPRFQSGEQTAYADHMLYDGQQDLSILTGDAAFQEGEQKAFADVIEYRRQKEKVILRGNAQVEDGKQIITADVINYDLAKSAYTTEGKTQLYGKDTKILADQTSYDPNSEMTLLRGNVYVQDKSQIILADSLDFNQEKGSGIARGNVFFQDTAQNLSIKTNYLSYTEENGGITAIGRPILATVLDGDTLWLGCDTLQSYQEQIDTSSFRVLNAYGQVRIFKSDLQVACDSLIFSENDSIFRFFDQPFLWSDGSQFSGDTVLVKLAQGKIDSIYLLENGMIINEVEKVFYNQLQGKNIYGRFLGGLINELLVDGNGESIYYITDEENAFVGVNQTTCGVMRLYFEENTVSTIKFFSSPSAQLFPMKQANHESLKISRFRWLDEARPKSKKDLKKPVLIGLPKIKDKTDTKKEEAEEIEEGEEESPAKGRRGQRGG